MTDDTDVDDVSMRLRFYGAGDYATYWQSQEAADIIQRFNPSARPEDVNGILELHNARLFVEAGFTPKDLPEAEQATLTEAAGPIRRVVAQWFHALEDEDLDDKLSDVDWQYHEHLLELLAGLGVFGRCSATPMLAALDRARIHPGDLLTSKRLVENYDTQVRDLVLADPDRAELVIRHHLEDQVRKETFLPASLTPADQRALIQKYIDSDNPNGNYLKLVANAPIDAKTGVDKRLIVNAKRRYDAQVKEFFATNTGIRTGCSVSVSDTQIEPMTVSLDDTVIEYTFSEAWLEDTLDNASVLNNFQFLFEFAPEDGLLTMPAVDSERRGLESVFGLDGTHDYLTGHVFAAKDLATLSQTVMYRRFLEARDIDLEEVLRWYFEEHLASELGITGFAFTPSSSTANYLERCRNLFAEMESIATQYNLFIEDGEIDHDVATAGADLVRYRAIPSALEGKYAYATDHPEIQSILHILFSDQSHLAYVDDNLSGDNAVDLLVRNEVPYQALHAFQQPMIDKLIEIGLAENTGQRIVLTNFPLFSVLRSLSHHEAVAYHHLDQAARAHVDTMIDAGWLVRRSTLLTEAEAAYFNYNLNSVDFSNGPKLRNKYQHGVQPKGEGEAQHQDTYYRALRLMIALTIKINDELVLASAENGIPTADETPADRDS
ncbi:MULTISPECIES: hypothetical protein [unclassified Nocardioides]|uniref:hypothetical protein n=1 Tax=unclassified Nocardioides TaxID=2615069 RepID=UPI0009F07537|nr:MULTISPECIES: hypothetical protein [unclassified Nocardioides]GAW51370.1 uncharacterized protein PD653B2_3712 [Nocardioides sp. PD653-B2]GAW54197.1 uncharacterized protein PD653_1605 [Nocardioides sp. PD653]